MPTGLFQSLRNSLGQGTPRLRRAPPFLLIAFVMNGEPVNGAWGFGLVLAHGA